MGGCDPGDNNNKLMIAFDIAILKAILNVIALPPPGRVWVEFCGPTCEPSVSKAPRNHIKYVNFFQNYIQIVNVNNYLDTLGHFSQ